MISDGAFYRTGVHSQTALFLCTPHGGFPILQTREDSPFGVRCDRLEVLQFPKAGDPENKHETLTIIQVLHD